MRLAKLVMACGLTIVLLAACGIEAKPLAGTAHIDSASGNHAQLDDSRLKHAKCLRSDGFRIREYRTVPERYFAIQIGSLPKGPTVVFYPTAGIAQGLQLQGKVESAEVIGTALLYPNGESSDKQLNKIEKCVALGVGG